MTANEINALVDRLREQRNLSDAEFKTILETDAYDAALQKAADEVRRAHYGTDVYVRGLIEFTNYCKNNCYYCGIRRDNRNATRYRLTKEEILSCCAEGYDLGFRTFVLQGGEDPFYTDDLICEIVAAIHAQHPDCAITLSLGERERESYQRFFDAGADRYLLRHETADPDHYAALHPAALSFDHRIQCLRDLKDIGYQVGCGFLVGSPGQTPELLAKDLKFVEEFQPAMCGIGPFIPQQDTPLRDEAPGTAELTVYLLSILRLIQPNLLLPATTALGTIQPNGRELGLAAGANVVMPNLSPLSVRKKYALYDGKICTGEEGAQCVGCLQGRVASVGYTLVSSRGDIRTI